MGLQVLATDGILHFNRTGRPGLYIRDEAVVVAAKGSSREVRRVASSREASSRDAVVGSHSVLHFRPSQTWEIRHCCGRPSAV